jgi:hypothetical protein
LAPASRTTRHRDAQMQNLETYFLLPAIRDFSDFSPFSCRAPEYVTAFACRRGDRAMITALIVIGQCVVVAPAANPDQPAPPWQGHVVFRTDDGYGVAPLDRPSIPIVVPAESVAPCEPKALVQHPAPAGRVAGEP